MRKTIPCLAAIAIGCISTTIAAEGSSSTTNDRVYSVYYLPFFEAKLLVEEKLGEEAATAGIGDYKIDTEPTRGDAAGSPTGYLHVHADRETQERIAAVLKKLDVPPPDRVLQVFLLEASKQGSASPDLPPGAAKAVHDLQEVMPFRGFRLLESGVLRSARAGRVTLGSDFNLEFAFRSQRDSSKPVLVEQFILRHSTPSKTDSTKLETRNVIETSFSIKPSETVVVGTSKLDGGDQALVVLVTALE